MLAASRAVVPNQCAATPRGAVRYIEGAAKIQGKNCTNVTLSASAAAAQDIKYIFPYKVPGTFERLAKGASNQKRLGTTDLGSHD